MHGFGSAQADALASPAGDAAVDALGIAQDHERSPLPGTEFGRIRQEGVQIRQALNKAITGSTIGGFFFHIFRTLMSGAFTPGVHQDFVLRLPQAHIAGAG